MATVRNSEVTSDKFNGGIILPDDNNNLHLQQRAVQKPDSTRIQSYDPLLVSPILQPMGWTSNYCWLMNLQYLNITQTTQNL